ncbi:ABC transporter ATP-binding protein [Sutcliffiella rhizosphaerae]|uniref:Metal-staphylopine import system ATP-binding protein CntD n=1 Tax=Sutcliffiella rhizosphaerae TaxID=2880967 RepID=A0ABM8YRW8_9BACI|nr:ABC transporter ATP-binding protein [Sutcliffiella rhizosphaerae]CAG9622747.1 Metal-staphylopine import system ATP-binding protein CntD [Sutcliffiella rhizosphaerae]
MILSLEQLTITNKETRLVDHVSLSIKDGEWFALVGQSGSGKSLLSHSIGQISSPNLKVNGKILFKGKDLLTFTQKEMRRIRGKEIAYIFQDYQSSFTPFRTIGQHLDEYQKAHGILDKKERLQNSIHSLHFVGLEDALYNRYPFQLSGGQLQRVSIASALLLSPDLIIADEITTALDSVSGHHVLELLASKQKETGCTILFITHDWRHVRRYADRLAIMKDGNIVEKGSKHRILDHPSHQYTKELISAAPFLGKGLPSGLEERQTK